MSENNIEKIVNYFYRNEGEKKWKKNEKYSNNDVMVFEREEDKHPRITVEEKGDTELLITQTDSTGKIISWDVYQNRNNEVVWIKTECLGTDGQRVSLETEGIECLQKILSCLLPYPKKGWSRPQL